MATFEKLLPRFLALDKNLRFKEVQKVMNHLGYKGTYPGGETSHHHSHLSAD